MQEVIDLGYESVQLQQAPGGGGRKEPAPGRPKRGSVRRFLSRIRTAMIVGSLVGLCAWLIRTERVETDQIVEHGPEYLLELAVDALPARAQEVARLVIPDEEALRDEAE